MLKLAGPIDSQTIPVSYGRTSSHEQSADRQLPAAITWTASKQTYLTIRLLVDRDRVLDAYRAYAYFRWLDDSLDHHNTALSERVAFIARQQAIIDGSTHPDLTHEERLLVDLMRNHPGQDTGLRSYLKHMMAIMDFDARRRGRLITRAELDRYTGHLATAVTDAMHYFIGHDCYAPCDQARYRAVTGAHITHMLRDTLEDVEAGYFNIAREYVETEHIDPADVAHDRYRDWVRNRVQLARDCFRTGRDYLSRVESRRCRMAGYAYMVRFECVLDAIEADGYRLRRDYPERKRIGAALRTLTSALNSSFKR